jgi:FG-GAP-like repeat
MTIKSKILILVSISCYLIGLNIFTSCSKKNTTEGENLAKTYCSSCHMLPKPELLPANVWKFSTLPYMGILLGIKNEVKNLPEPLKPYKVLMPDIQVISDEDFAKIKEYYLENAPKKLTLPFEKSLPFVENIFGIEPINILLTKSTIPNFTLAAIDTINQKIITSDQSNRIISIFDKKGKNINNITNQNAATNIDFKNAYKNEYLINFIGKTTQANQEVEGYALNCTAKNNNFDEAKIILNHLNRPVTITQENFDNKDDIELLTTEFGFKDSGLSLWKKNAKGNYIKKYLSNTTGAIKAIVKDFNDDKKPDIMALFAQGDERIVLYLNKGNLEFNEKILLRFPPIYGSSSFDLGDLNNDGKEDIIYTAGDNADFTTILKPYHGVYIFENQGNFNFKQTHFFHQNGAYKCIAKDFDQDGDIDIVSISLFPDVKNRPQESFIYFENNKGNYTQKTLNINHLGRWSVMDAGDVDGDGDIDLVLGSHPVAKFPTGFDQAWKQGSGLVILRNKTIKK